MVASRQPFASWLGVLLMLASIFLLSDRTYAQDNQYVSYTTTDGETVYLRDDRRPALYTQNFGDCQGDSLINVTRFDAAYYKDNMTVLFHLAGDSSLTNQSLMLYIGVFAYGEQRFELTFNPCDANIYSLCPLNSSVPIEASGIIPVAPSDVANIPPIALTIPDFEGQAILRIFANSTESQIGCYSAIVTNGASFAHPATVGTVLGLFTALALVSSVGAAMYGASVPEMRKHYAHSMSVWVVFSVLQHIFFTGVLSMNWPSVLVAFWSNYAWSAGMIYTEGMQNSINRFIGSNGGNISMVGSAPSGVTTNNLGGGYDISQIYKRAVSFTSKILGALAPHSHPRSLEHEFSRRALANSSTGFSWYGSPVRPGLPLPGNFSSFAGTLGEENIPASNAFLTGFLWFIILIVCVIGGMTATKFIIELLAKVRVIKTQRLDFFRTHWILFTAAMVLRTCFIAFFMMIVLSTFQFVLGGPVGARAIAGVVFVLFFLGMTSTAVYAVFYRIRNGNPASQSDTIEKELSEVGATTSNSTDQQSRSKDSAGTKKSPAALSWARIHFSEKDSGRASVHNDEEYTRKFGWLASRFRKSKWWFFSFWLVYEFVRACFYGGAAGHALVQVFGLLVVEILALIAIVLIKPFESNRLNLLMVYFMGFSKVTTVALSSAFDARFGLPRITTTVIGVVIIVIQGILTILLMLGIALGAISTYMSITRNREEIKPISWLPYRTRYFAHIDQKETDRPAPPKPARPAQAISQAPSEPSFMITSVRRQPKIEDEDGDNDLDGAEYQGDGNAAEASFSRTQSLRSRTSASNIPYGARLSRNSWSSREFHQRYDDDPEAYPSHTKRMSGESFSDLSTRPRPLSQRLPPRTGAESPVGVESLQRASLKDHGRTHLILLGPNERPRNSKMDVQD